MTLRAIDGSFLMEGQREGQNDSQRASNEAVTLRRRWKKPNFSAHRGSKQEKNETKGAKPYFTHGYFAKLFGLNLL